MNLRSVKILVLAVTVMVSGLLFGGAFLQSFDASSQGEDVVITWETAQENNLLKFVVMRGPDKNNMAEITSIQPKGNYSFYEYKDKSAYKTNDADYVYQLKIVDNDLSDSYSAFREVNHKPSSVKRTWGSIKALFR